jgi:hypothetical protein
MRKNGTRNSARVQLYILNGHVTLEPRAKAHGAKWIEGNGEKIEGSLLSPFGNNNREI